MRNVFIAIGLLTIFTMLAPKTTFAGPFVDIPDEHELALPLVFLKQQGVVHGHPDGTFQPDDTIQRVEILKMTYWALRQFTKEEFPVIAQANSASSATHDIATNGNATKDPFFQTNAEIPNFTDIDPNEWYGEYLRWGYDRNIIEGYEDGTFHPADPVNLAEALKMLLAGYTELENLRLTHRFRADPYIDAPRGEWFTTYIQYAKDRGLLPLEEDYIHPDILMTRGRWAEILYKLFTQRPVFQGYVSFYGDEFHGRGTASGDTFSQDEFTAAHPSLPFGSILRLKNPETGAQVEVRVNDRGPYMKRRIVDLSRRAFETIAPLGTGVLEAIIEIIK